MGLHIGYKCKCQQNLEASRLSRPRSRNTKRPLTLSWPNSHNRSTLEQPATRVRTSVAPGQASASTFRRGPSYMTIYLDPATISIALASSAISIFATWYFSKRHYSRPPRPQPVTENDIKLRDTENLFRFSALCILGFLILIVILVFGYESPTDRNQQTIPTPTTNSQQELLTPEGTDPPLQP